MFCIGCGVLLPEGANFCYKCGREQSVVIDNHIHNEIPYSNLVEYDYDDVEVAEIRYPYKMGSIPGSGSNCRLAFIIVHKDSKVGVYDECFERKFVPCIYDSVNIFYSYNAFWGIFFKVSLNNKYYLFRYDEMIIDRGFDDIIIENGTVPFVIAFKDAGKFGFRLEKKVKHQTSRMPVIFDAVYDSISINYKDRVVFVEQGGKWGMIGPFGSELPCIFDSIRIERRPSQLDPNVNYRFYSNGGKTIREGRWLIVKYKGKEYEYLDMCVRKQKEVDYGFILYDYNIFFLMEEISV